MSDTLVIQSHKSPLPYPWLSHCLDSVQHWCGLNQYDYRFMGDELFELMPHSLLEKTEKQKVIATDLARLLVLKEAQKSGYETVIWLDADFFIFRPDEFIIPNVPYAVGREIWVQNDKQGRLKVYKKVHNAFLMFRQGNSFLDFYIETAQRLLTLNTGTMPAQFIGPKLLTALHNVALLPVLESAGMLSPMVIKDLLRGEGTALSLFKKQISNNMAAANLCASSCMRDEVGDNEMSSLIDLLKDQTVSRKIFSA